MTEKKTLHAIDYFPLFYFQTSLHNQNKQNLIFYGYVHLIAFN